MATATQNGNLRMRFDVREGARAGDSFEVGARRVVVGRERDCDFALDDPGVSGEHVSIKSIDGHIEVHDLGSSSGTYVNGRKIEGSARIEPGDEVRIGSEILIAVEAAVEGNDSEGTNTVSDAAPRRYPTTRHVWGGFRRYGMIAVATAVILGGAMVAVLAQGSHSKAHKARPAPPPALTGAEVATRDRPSTVMVVARLAAGSPLVALNGGSNLFGTATGWVYDAGRGLIVTNAHAVVNAASVQVGYDASTLIGARIVGVDLKHDIALLRVPEALLPGLRSLRMARSTSVRQGDAAFALGYPGNGGDNPLKTTFQVTSGSVSATTGVGVSVDTDPLGQANDNAALFESDLYQTDAPIRPGSSGGPLVNDHGELIGMSSAGGSAPGQGYAIPVSTIASVLPTLERGDSIAWPGFGAIPMSSALAGHLHVDGGLLITSVARDTPADQAGLGRLLGTATKYGAWLVVYTVNNQPVTTEGQFVRALTQAQSGETITLGLYVVGSNGHVVPLGRVHVTMP